jgi:hypothetical protein
MSFFKLVAGTQFRDEFKITFEPPLILNGEYEIALVENFVTKFRRLLGKFIVFNYQRGYTYTLYYRSTGQHKPKTFEFFTQNIPEKPEIQYDETNEKLIIECKNIFQFDNQFAKKQINGTFK